MTYRPPDNPDDEQVDAALPVGIAAAFYRDIQSRFDGQVIIMENLDPTEPLDDDSIDVVFTSASTRAATAFSLRRKRRVPSGLSDGVRMKVRYVWAKQRVMGVAGSGSRPGDVD